MNYELTPSITEWHGTILKRWDPLGAHVWLVRLADSTCKYQLKLEWLDSVSPTYQEDSVGTQEPSKLESQSDALHASNR